MAAEQEVEVWKYLQEVLSELATIFVFVMDFCVIFLVTRAADAATDMERALAFVANRFDWGREPLWSGRE